jgi:hypothetical protein
MAQLRPLPTRLSIRRTKPGGRLQAVHKILYSSVATVEIDQHELETILQVSRRNNEPSQLTGMLLHHPATQLYPATFIQVLEGERDVLEAAYARIAEDPRHTDLKLLSSRATDRRLFGSWSMGLEYVTDDDLQRVLPGFAPDDPDAVRIQDLTENPAVAEMLLHLYVG